MTPGYTGPGSPGAPQYMGAPPIAGQFQPGMGGIQQPPLIPPMSMPSYNFPGNYLPGQAGMQGFMPPAIGGQWNQLAQQMAGRMYLPPAPGGGIPSPLTPPPVVHPPVTMPMLPPTVPQGPYAHGGRVLAAGGGGGGGAAAGMGLRGYGGGYTMPGITLMPNDPVFGIDGSPGSVIPSPFGGGGMGGGTGLTGLLGGGSSTVFGPRVQAA